MFFDQEDQDHRYIQCRACGHSFCNCVNDFDQWEEELRDGLSLNEQQLIDFYRWNLDTGGDAS